MKKNIFFLTINFFIILGCSNLNNSQTSLSKELNISSSYEKSNFKNYKNFKDFIIDINQMFNQKESNYGVYFYSEYCPACASLKELLFNFLESENKCIDNLYLVDIGATKEEDFNKLKPTSGLFEEEIINKNIGVSSIENLYFRTSPCIYFINNIDNKNIVVDHYINYQDVYDFLLNNSLK